MVLVPFERTFDLAGEKLCLPIGTVASKTNMGIPQVGVVSRLE